MNKDVELIEKALDVLREHFDTAQIFVTRAESVDGTVNAQRGFGNWFARYGQIQAYLVKEHEDLRLEIRKENSSND